MGHFAQFGLVTLDLANTWDAYLDEPERLPDVAALRRFCDELEEAATEVGESDLAAVRAVRSRLRAVLAAEPGERARALAAWAAELPARAVVAVVDGLPELRLAAAGNAPPADRLAVRAVRELLAIAGAGDWERLRLCAATPCRDAFVDRSRPGRRQFCSTRCANRAHAAASRARHRA
ncbi:CGNR zinc finger domain-containing protein [Nonomuraea sp. NPDC047897]|uniref:CGNR zinc finger domain-containing protein n=1 Tax=Nonomuraea sp. NPDC047897 TaxID=3364346 RepID=UPI0037146DAA